MNLVQLIPKYVRINTLKENVEGVIRDMRKEGFTMGTRDEIYRCFCLSQDNGGEYPYMSGMILW